MKNILSIILLFSVFNLSASFAVDDDKKDFTLDLKTSTLVPKFMGKVKIVRGKVMDGDNELSKGDKIYPKNFIVTSEKSFIVIDLVDESVLTLGPSSEFKVENWFFRNKSDREGALVLLKGKLRAEIKVKTKQEDQLKIKTPLVSMGIRGTEVLLNNSLVNGKWLSQVALIEGRVELINKSTNKNTTMAKDDYIELGEGQGSLEVLKKLSVEEIKKYNAIVAPDEKLLMDFPAVAMNELVLDPKEAGTDGGALVRPLPDELSIFSKQKESVNWRDNLKKLNDLRKKH